MEAMAKLLGLGMAHIIGIVVVLVLVAVALLVGDRNPRIDGGEWRVRPSDSGKTWILYRRRGLATEKSTKRFKSAEAAIAFARSMSPGPAEGAQTEAIPLDRSGPRENPAVDLQALANEESARSNAYADLASQPGSLETRLAYFRLANQHHDRLSHMNLPPRKFEEWGLAELNRRLEAVAGQIIVASGSTHALWRSAIPHRSTDGLENRVKVAVWARDGGACVKCGALEQLGFLPTWPGGGEGTNNIQLVCTDCTAKAALRARGPVRSARRQD
ncbi:MAG: hypothetical protein JWM33_2767 [Caulobacteraceae bacterium]|nr:hypothetical protein [Caulobacteraceae bacterium]